MRRPRTQAIDDVTGFKVDHSSLKKQWDGAMTVEPDKRNPQDFIRARKESGAISDSRPEPADQFFLTELRWEDGITLMTLENGFPIISETSIARTLP